MPTNPLPSSARSALREAGPLEAGRELDVLVAERLFGYVWHAWEDSGPFTYLLLPTDTEYGEVCIARRRDGVLELNEYTGPHYSTSIAAAWLVVEEMARRGWKVDVQNRYAPTWACHVSFAAPDYRNVFEHKNTAPLAICIAALEAIAGASPTGGTTE